MASFNHLWFCEYSLQFLIKIEQFLCTKLNVNKKLRATYKISTLQMQDFEGFLMELIQKNLKVLYFLCL